MLNHRNAGQCHNCGKRLPNGKTGRCKECRSINRLVRLILRNDLNIETDEQYERRRAAEREARLTVKVHRGLYG